LIRKVPLFSLGTLLAITLVIAPAIAQDSQYRPVNQQFPAPECLTLGNAYSAALAHGYKPCSAGTRDAWLQDLEQVAASSSCWRSLEMTGWYAQ
jgi:hypothetical protein